MPCRMRSGTSREAGEIDPVTPTLTPPTALLAPAKVKAAFADRTAYTSQLATVSCPWGDNPISFKHIFRQAQ